MDYRKLVHRLIGVSMAHRYHISKNARKAGLYFGQHVILDYITKHNGCTQIDLANALFISAPSVATSLKRLEKSGSIRREEDSADARKKHIYITPQGQKLIESFRAICDETDSRMFSGFSQEDCLTLKALLDRLYTNLDGDRIRKEADKTFFDKEDTF